MSVALGLSQSVGKRVKCSVMSCTSIDSVVERISPLLVGVRSALISFVTLFAGNAAAAYFVRRRVADKAAVLGGIALILIEIRQII